MQVTEYVTLGHPDKVADYISSHILDRSQQSPDIAQGLDGWGDQGVFFGAAWPMKVAQFGKNMKKWPLPPWTR